VTAWPQRCDSRTPIPSLAAAPASRPATILVADAVGYTEAMSVDELGTIAVLAESRSVIQSAVASHNGRIFSMKGDSIFVEYGSSGQGLRSATAMQRALSCADSLGRKVLRFRIGLHVGRVYPDGQNLLGETINIAARLERLATPGGVCISGQIRSDAEPDDDLLMEHLGSQLLKGVPNPVYVTLCRPR
jgi:adenylate cyclase